MKYAGIGSRQTPQNVLYQMHTLGKHFARMMILRSGRARGADQAFESGARQAGGIADLFTPDDVTPSMSSWYEHAARYHPNWKACNPYAQKLHARNSPIVLGRMLNDPVAFIVCWTRDGKATGGTGQALRIAADPLWNIPVFNLYYPDNMPKLMDWLSSWKPEALQ